jgi:anthranilate phosphoribosyltransferase
LAGVEGPAQRIVLANVAVALLAAEKTSTLRDGVAAARTAITSGRARRVIETLRAMTI